MKSDTIAEVAIDASGQLHIRPAREEFPHIWRAAMEVNWNESSRTLHSRPPRTWSHVDWYRQIVAAVKDEYGYALLLTPETIWTNVSAETQRAIISTARAEA